MNDLYELSERMIRQKNRPFRRYLLDQSPFGTSLTILVGQRGTGKTTLMIQYMLKHNNELCDNMLYVPMDHFIIGTRTMYEIASEFEKQGGKLICFDEIHKYSDWSKELKSINDTMPNLQVIASGSSILKIRKGSHDLSRRAVVRTLRSMSFREWLGIQGLCSLSPIALSDLLDNHSKLCSDVCKQLQEKDTSVLMEFAKYLSVGYYPYSIDLKTEDLFYLTLEQSVHTTIENDLPALVPTLTGASVSKIKRLLALICGIVPFQPDMVRLKRSLHIGDERTLKTYLKYLEDGGIIRTLHRQGKSLNNLDKPDKIYLDNPNLMKALGNDCVDVGSMRETYFLSCFDKSTVTLPVKGDFSIGKYLFEVGGKNKGFSQIADIEDSWLVQDQIEIGYKNKIPLWLFGFMY